jgi:hypothetical protein
MLPYIKIRTKIFFVVWNPEWALKFFTCAFFAAQKNRNATTIRTSNGKTDSSKWRNWRKLGNKHR